MKIGYIRVSTGKQRTDRQISGMKDMCDKLYIEQASAVSDKRPVFDEVLNVLKSGDTLLVWDMDRAFRSTEDAIVHARELQKRGVLFQAVNFVIDTQTADGNYAYQVNAAAAERERRKISERTKQGLERARQRGVRLGRPPKLNAKQINEAKKRLANGETLIRIASSYRVHLSTLKRHIKRYDKQGVDR